MKVKILVSFCLLLVTTSCGSQQDRKGQLKVAATPVPHAQMLEYIKPDLQAQGIDLKVIVTEDYNMPNRALAEGEVQANFFQHIPFLEDQIRQFDYPIESIAKIEIEPMGLYSKKMKKIEELPVQATIAIPSDPTNEARALLLLQAHGLITLGKNSSLQATVHSIIDNPKHLCFLEVDPAMLPRSLLDVDAAVINTNYALEAGLVPLRDALILENKDSPYVNVLVVQKEGAENLEIQALKKAMTSDKMRQFILTTYQGAIEPAF